MKLKYCLLDLPLCVWVLLFLLCATSFTVAQSGSAGKEGSTAGNMICWWSFDAETGRSAYDEIRQKKESIYGSFKYVPGVSGNATKLDGFRTFIKRDRHNLSNLDGAFTVEGWIALASYPWSWSPLVDCSYERLRGFFFGIDSEGHLGFKTGAAKTEAITIFEGLTVL